MFDVVCVGAGPAGAVTAACLARRGRRVLVLDRAEFPREKACGEGILPEGVQVLDALGLRLPEARRIAGFRFVVGGRTHDAPFPSGQTGLAVRRSILDHALWTAAIGSGASFERVRVRSVTPGEGGAPGEVVTDRGVFRGRFLVGADGAASVFHRSLGLRVARDGSRVGMSFHARGFPAEPGVVTITSLPEGEIYVTPVDGDLVLVALLLDRARAPRPAGAAAFVARAFPGVRVRPGSRVLAAFPLATRVSPRAGPGWLCVGDSAGKVDPVSGQGLGLALRGGALAAEVLDVALRGEGSPLDFARRAAPRLRSAERLTRLLLMASRHPRITGRLLPRVAPPEGHLLRAAVGLERCSWLRAARDLAR